MRLLPLLSFALLACDSASGDTSGGADTADSATSGDTSDTSETGETGETGDTGAEGPADLGFQLEGGWEGSTLTLTWVDPSSLGTESLNFGGVLLSEDVSQAETLIHAGRPPESDLQELNPEETPGMLMALYVPALHLDVDGDGLPQNGESFMAVGMTWAVYVTGVIPAEFTQLGVVDGWNAVVIAKEGDPQFADAMTIPLPVNLAPNLELTAGGDLGFDPDGARLMVISGQAFTGESPVGPLVDQALTDPWEVALSGPPAADRFYLIQNMGIMGALEVPLSYDDANHSGAFEEASDSLLFAACSDAVPVGFLWLPPPSDLYSAFGIARMGVGSGWMAVQLAEGGSIVPPSLLTELVMDQTCGLGG